MEDRQAPVTPASLEALVRDHVGRRAERYVGLSVAVASRGVQAHVGFGQRDDSGAPITTETSFQIGSVTKLFTALLLADAVRRGEVTLDQPLHTLIPEAATHPSGRAITLVDLATHTSGLPRLPPGLLRQGLRNRPDPYAAFTSDDLLTALATGPKRRPGGRVRYSNYGAGVLGEALARAIGRPYLDAVHARISAPLGLHGTGPVPRDVEAAVGHTRRRRPTPDWHLPALAGAGALRSTAADMLRFLGAHLDPGGTPLAGAIATVLEPRQRVGRVLRLGLGWHVLDRRDAPPVWWHNGGTGGFFSFVAIVPETSTSVAVLTNTARSVDRIGMRMVAALDENG